MFNVVLFVGQHWIIALVLIVLFFVIVVGSAMLEGYLEGKERLKGPKEEMYWCHKHGAFRKIHCIELFPEMGPKVNKLICPMCYKEVVWDNPNKALKV